MNDELLTTLKALPLDPARVVDLYPQLYSGEFLVPMKAGTENNFEAPHFFTYPDGDNGNIIPVYTRKGFILLQLPADSVIATHSGPVLWPVLLRLIDGRNCEIAIDPGQPHGIAIKQSMILGMVSAYGPKPT